MTFHLTKGRPAGAAIRRRLTLGLTMTVFAFQTLMMPAAAQTAAEPTNTAPASQGPSPLPANPSIVPSALPEPGDQTEATPPDAESNAPSDDTPMGPRPYTPGLMSEGDTSTLSTALNAVKSRNFSYAESLRNSLSDPLARKLILWSIINNDGADIYGFATLDAARRELWGWPREQKRQVAAERMIATSGLTPAQIIEWFNGTPPETYDAAMTLIRSYEVTGATTEAGKLAKHWWRGEVFDAASQEQFYASFGKYLEPLDHRSRLDLLLIGPQGAAATRMLDFVEPGYRRVGEAAIALRSERAGASDLFNSAMIAYPGNAVLSFEGAKFLRRHGLESLAYPLLANLPAAPDNETIGNSLWAERLAYYKSALKARDYVAAYHAMNQAGFEKGEKKAESEFFAGFMALTRLRRPEEALKHFNGVKIAGTSPITQGRANYWIGRAHEALGQTAEAQAAYKEGSQYIYTFYGQLAAEKAGITEIRLGKDPVPSAEDKSRFENRDMVRAARMVGALGNRDQFRALIIALANTLPNAEEEALLYDLAKSYDTQDIASRAARISQQRGFYLPERAYPLRSIPPGRGPEPAMVMAITRQESGFDPNVRSHANARGMMQIIPSTGRILARKLSVGYSDNKLFEADYNMTLGSYYLAEMIDRFGGSYIMAAAGYNAGPGRPAAWVQIYADPRGKDGDPFSFIEGAPFNETRDYMMRVTENLRVYRARLNGGVAPLTALNDIKRGQVTAPVDESDLIPTSGPISYLQYQKSGPVDPSAAPATQTANLNVMARPLQDVAAAPVRAEPVPLDMGASNVVLPSVSKVKAQSPKKATASKAKAKKKPVTKKKTTASKKKVVAKKKKT